MESNKSRHNKKRVNNNSVTNVIAYVIASYEDQTESQRQILQVEAIYDI